MTTAAAFNAAIISGECTSIRHQHGAVLARIALPGERREFVRVKLPDEGDITLFAGDQVQVSGRLTDYPYTETLPEFLRRACSLETAGRALAEYAELSIRRATTVIIPDAISATSLGQNTARLEGVIVKIWTYGGSRYARIVTERDSGYLTIQFTDGMAGGRLLPDLKAGDRIRLTGRLIQRIYYESLRDFLTDARRADLIPVIGAERVDSIRARYLQTAVEADSLVVFS